MLTAADIWRSYEVPGVPASGPHAPRKAEIAAWGTLFETLLAGGAPGLGYASKAALDADLLHAANVTALVYGDATAGNNGMYVKSGASGAGSWSRIGDLPNGIVTLSVTGGTANALQVSAPETPQTPGKKLYLLTPTAANTTATTIALNGGTPVAVKNAFGVDLAANSFVIGQQVLMAWSVDHYQLLISAQVDASAILASAVAAQNAAASSASSAATSASLLGNQVQQYDTRAQAIAATIPVGVQAIKVTRYAAGSPLSYATYIPGGSSGPMAFQEAAGNWWQLDLSGGVVDPAWFGAIGDGTTDNLTAINTAITAAGWRGIIALNGGVFHCSAEPTNPKGVYFRGAGYIETPEAVTGRARRWDTRGEQFPIVEGKEYLNIVHEIFRAGSASSTKIDFMGDSTIIGNGITDTNYVLSTLIQNNFLLHGFDCQFTNRAVGGTTSEDLRTTQVPASIAISPHLAIIGTGINDVYLRGPNPGVNTDAQAQAAAELVRVSLDAALATYRASFPATRTCIILKVPNVATLTLNARDERYIETISPMYRELARKYQCVFIDTYRAWRFGRGLNAASAVGVPWLDTPYTTNDGGIHPLESFSMQIADLLTEVILPETLRRAVRANLPQLNTGLAFSNGWTALAGQSFRARRRGQVVQLEGTIVPGTTTTGTLITTLPTTMWPARRRFFGCTTNASGQVPAMTYVDTDGTVRMQTFPAGATSVVMEHINYIVGD